MPIVLSKPALQLIYKRNAGYPMFFIFDEKTILLPAGWTGANSNN